MGGSGAPRLHHEQREVGFLVTKLYCRKEKQVVAYRTKRVAASRGERLSPLRLMHAGEAPLATVRNPGCRLC